MAAVGSRRWRTRGGGSEHLQVGTVGLRARGPGRGVLCAGRHSKRLHSGFLKASLKVGSPCYMCVLMVFTVLYI